MEAICCSETLADFQRTTQRYTTELFQAQNSETTRFEPVVCGRVWSMYPCRDRTQFVPRHYPAPETLDRSSSGNGRVPSTVRSQVLSLDNRSLYQECTT
jgi:hypothetical protein